jgi:hypothetical protein
LRLTRTLFAILAISGPIWGQSASSVDQQSISQLVKQIQELQQHERELEERIRVLEANQKSAVSPETAASTPVSDVPVAPVAAIPAAVSSPVPSVVPPAISPAVPSAVPAPSQEAQAASAALAPEYHRLRGIQWRGFGELDYKVLNQRTPELGTYGFVPGSLGNFYIADFDLFLNSRLNDKTSILSEIDFEEGNGQSFKVDLRRMLLKYDVNDHFRFSFGRYQTNIGYYNWAFRSASWLQTTADRPFVMEYASDGGPLPTQAIGVSVTGSLPSGKLGLNYVAEYGSADTIRPDVTGDGLSTDENNGNHINVGFFLTPDRFPGLRIGGSFYRDQISNLADVTATGLQIPLPTDSERWNQSIVNGHVVYVAHGIEFLNEAFLIRDAPIAPIGPRETFNTPAFYSQFSKKLGPFRPFFRYQYFNASSLNLIYNDVGLRCGPSFGARYDLNEFLAFKAQFDRTARRGLPDINGLHLQISGTF